MYVAALDGMLHAFCAAPPTQTCVLAGARGGTFQRGEEIWAFLPPSQLPLLKSNTQGLDASPRVEDVKDLFSGTTQWRTMLVITEGSFGNNVYALDVTDPIEPQLLWRRTPADADSRLQYLGNSAGAALGVAATTPRRGLVWVSSNVTGGRGMIVYGLNAVDGTYVWSFKHDYLERKFIGCTGETPNGIPAPAQVAPTAADGDLERVFIGDLDGNVWQLNAMTGANVNSGTTPLYATTACGQPFGAPVALSRDVQHPTKLIVIAATGGADWTLAGALGDQFAIHVITLTQAGAQESVRDLDAGVIPRGERIYSQPVVRGQEIFAVSSSRGMFNRLDCNSDFTSGTGSGYRIYFDENWATQKTTISASSTFWVGQKSGALITSSASGSGTATPAEPHPEASTTSVLLAGSPSPGKLRLWVQRP